MEEEKLQSAAPTRTNVLGNPLAALAFKYLNKAITEKEAVTALKFLPFFKITKLAEILGVTRQTIYNWIKEYGKKGGENRGTIKKF